MDSLRPLNTLTVDQLVNQRLKSTPSPSPLTWVSQNWSQEKDQFDFTPTFMLEPSKASSFSSNKEDTTHRSNQEKERRTPSPVSDEENEEVSTDEGSWENSSNPSATTEASTSTNSSHQITTLIPKPEFSSVSKIEVLDPIVVEALRKKNLSPSIIASAAASPFTPSSLKTLDIKTISSDRNTYIPVPPAASNSQLVNFQSNLRANSEILNLGRISPECEWSLNESGLLKSNNEDVAYEIADEILQLQITPPQQTPFTGDRNIRVGEMSRRDVLNGRLQNENNHSRHSSHSSSATYESDYSNMTRTSSTSSYITSTTTPDRSPATHKSINNGGNYFSTLPSTSNTKNYQPQSPTPGMSSQSQISNSPTSPFYPSQLQSSPPSNNSNDDSNLYHLALQSFLIASLPPSASTPSDAINELTVSLTTHFNQSMSTAHPLASLYGLSFSEGDTLVRNPRENGVSEEIWRLGVERMKFGLFAEEGRGGSDWSEFDEDGPSAGNRKFGLYKTELCRSWEEKGMCRYGTRCQFAHGINQVREIARHPKFKSEICRTFWIHGECPYGRRCCFLHTTGPNFSHNNLSNYNFSQQQQIQYPSISNLADYFEPSSSNIPMRYQSHLQQNHHNNRPALGTAFVFSERPQLSSSTSYQNHQLPYPLTPPYSDSASPSSFNHSADRLGSEVFSANDYFSSPISTSSIPCASPPVSRVRSGSILSLEENISRLSSDSMIGVKKLEPIGAEKMQGKIFSKGLEEHNITGGFMANQENRSSYNSLGLSLRSLDKTPLAQSKTPSPPTPSIFNFDLLPLS